MGAGKIATCWHGAQHHMTCCWHAGPVAWIFKQCQTVWFYKYACPPSSLLSFHPPPSTHLQVFVWSMASPHPPPRWVFFFSHSPCWPFLPSSSAQCCLHGRWPCRPWMPSIRLPRLDYFGRWPFGLWMSYGPPLGCPPFASSYWLSHLFVSIGELLLQEVAFWAMNVVWASIRTPSICLLALTVAPFRLHRWVISSISTPSLSLLLFFFQTILCLGGLPFSAGRWVISLIPPLSLIQPFLCFQTVFRTGGCPFSACRWVISLIPSLSLIQPFLCFQTVRAGSHPFSYPR